MSSTSILDQLRGRRTDAAPIDVEPDVPQVGAYARISDAYEGRETGVTEDGVNRQLEADRLIAQARGWTIRKEYVDNDVSAFKAGVVREAFEDMLDDLSAGVIQGIVCYNLDRFCRQVTDLERAVAIYDQARREKREVLFATAEGDLNLASDDGLTLARVMVAFANKASRDTARRVALKQREQRNEGQARFGQRPFGLVAEQTPGGTVWTLEPTEAAAIRAAVAGIVDGSMSIASITRAWNEQGLKTTRGKAWVTQTTTDVLRSPRLAGWLTHKGEIATHSETGALIRANHPALLSDEEYEALLVALDANAANSNRSPNRGEKRYLLSGIARCGNCGAKMAGAVTKRQYGDNLRLYYNYSCRPGARARDGVSGGCGKVAISMPGLDDMIERAVLPFVIAETRDVVLPSEKPFEAELLDLQTEKDQLWQAYRERQAPSELVFPRAKEIEDEIERLRREQAQWRRSVRVQERGEAITEQTWPTLSIEERAGHIEHYIEAVYIEPAVKRRGNSFDPARVSAPIWRKPADDDELLLPVPQ